MSRILLLDLSSLLFPIWHVSGSDPDPDHVSTATVARVRQLASEYDHAVVCCDSRKSFRREMAPEYKAQREKKPEALFFQIDRAKVILRDDGYPVLESEGFEADDVIATCVRHLSLVEDVSEIVVASSDKDLAQLVRGVDDEGRFPPVRMFSLTSNETRGVIEVRAKFGVGPERLGDWLALVGDASDNVKGAPGIGDKKASALIAKFGNLQGLFAAVEASATPQDWAVRFNGSPEGKLIGGPAVFASLKEHGAQVALARKLVELRSDVPITLEAILEKRAPKTTARDELKEDIDDAASAAGTETIVETQQEVNEQTGEVTEVQVQQQTQALQPAGNGKPAQQSTDFDRLMQQPVQWEKALEPRSPGEAFRMALHMHDSRMFSSYGSPDGVLSTIMLGRELGIGTMGSLRGIHNIKGRHALSADLMVALVLKSGKCDYFEFDELTDRKAVYRTKRTGRPEKTMTFEFSEAERAGLVKGDGNWQKWPTDMCKARCIARLARAVYPDVCFGLYVVEELQAAA